MDDSLFVDELATVWCSGSVHGAVLMELQCCNRTISFNKWLYASLDAESGGNPPFRKKHSVC